MPTLYIGCSIEKLYAPLSMHSVFDPEHHYSLGVPAVNAGNKLRDRRIWSYQHPVAVCIVRRISSGRMCDADRMYLLKNAPSVIIKRQDRHIRTCCNLIKLFGFERCPDIKSLFREMVADR